MGLIYIGWGHEGDEPLNRKAEALRQLLEVEGIVARPAVMAHPNSDWVRHSVYEGVDYYLDVADSDDDRAAAVINAYERQEVDPATADPERPCA